MISQHLTKIESARLNVNNVLQAAVADLTLAKRKAERTADQDRPYSFMRQHVQRAIACNDAVFLVALAYFEGMPKTDKPSTLLLYQDNALLLDTLIKCLMDRRSCRE